MRLEVTTDSAAIVALVQAQLATDPVRNTVLSSVLAGLRTDADGWCAHPDVDPSVLAVRSQAHTPVVVTAGWPELAPLADALAALPTLAAIGGPVPVIADLVAALGSRGLSATARIDERLFRLDELTEPGGVPGAATRATDEHRTVLAEWYRSFTLEVWGGLPEGFDAPRLVELGLQRAHPWLWTDASGAPCALAQRHPAAFGVSRIGPVYTPPELRGRGYGSAATAAATRDTLDDAAIPVLYTDLANPTSNRIYQRLGYYPVEDRTHVSFS